MRLLGLCDIVEFIYGSRIHHLVYVRKNGGCECLLVFLFLNPFIMRGKTLPVHPPAQIKDLPRRLLPNSLHRSKLFQ